MAIVQKLRSREPASAPRALRKAPALRRCLDWVIGIAAPVALSGLMMSVSRWPKPYTWQFLAVAILVTRFVGRWQGFCSLAIGTLVTWSLAVPFAGELVVPSPVYSGLVMFLATGAFALFVVSDLERTKSQLRDALQRERDANKLKDQFLASLSHELRTPLNVVLGYSRMLPAMVRTDAKAERICAVIERNATAQLRLVEDLLDVQRIVSGRFTLEFAPVDLQDLGKNVEESLRPAALAKGLHWLIKIDPIPLYGDAGRIQQVMWNLLSNAIKFTPEGGCIGLRAFQEADSVIVVVVDSGEGIPSHFIPHVFERFRQLDMSTTRRHFGMGLGLAIVKEIVERHGGVVTVESDGEGKGTTFTVRLPIVARPARRRDEPLAEASDLLQ